MLKVRERLGEWDRQAQVREEGTRRVTTTIVVMLALIRH